MAVPLILLSIPGQGDAWAASELQDNDTLQFWDNDPLVLAWVAEVSLSADWRVPLIDQLDGTYTALLLALGTHASVTHTVRNLITDGVVGEPEVFGILNNNLDIGGATPDLDGPPYIVEAGRIHSSGVLRGVRLTIAPEIEGVIHAGSSSAPAFMARIVNAGGQPVGPSSILLATYSIFQLSESDPDTETVIAGHDNVGLDLGETMFDSLQTDYQWGDTDNVGYNFRLIPDVLLRGPAFATARRHYRVRVDVTPVDGQPFQLRFRPWAD